MTDTPAAATPLNLTRSDDPTEYPAAALPTSRLVLHSNKHATAIMADGSKVGVRPPSVGEWRQVAHAYARARQQVRDAAGRTATGADATTIQLDALYGYDPTTDPDADPDAPGEKQPAPYAEAFATVLRLLGQSTIDADALPLWCSSGGLFQSLYDHWRTVDVVLAQPPDDTADIPPGGAGAVADSAPPIDAPIPPDGSAMPVFDLEAAVAEHTAAGTLNGPPPVAAGGISGTTPGSAVVAPVSG